MKEIHQKIHPKSGELSIGELSEKTKTKVVTIRYYESLGFFPDPRPKKSPRNRKYSSSYIDRLIFIKRLRTLGFSLKEILEMLKWGERRKKIPKKRLIKKIYVKMDFINEKMNELRKLKRELYRVLSG